MSIKLNPSWERVNDRCIKWPTSNKPCKEVFRNKLLGKEEMLEFHFNEEGKLISSNAHKYLFRIEIEEILASFACA